MGKFFEALKKSDAGKTEQKSTSQSDSNVLPKDETPIDSTHRDAASNLKPVSSQPSIHAEVDIPVPPPSKTNAAIRPQPVFRPGNVDKNLVVFHAPQSFEAEQFRILRTNILFPVDGKRPPRTILVTSTFPGEGKSFVASNLAFTIAQNIDRHVLLIDCDMRRPAVHKIFGYDRVPGLSNYLVGEGTLPELLIKTANNHLSILPGGPIPHNPAELLSSNRMLSFLREARSRYDDRTIIIDSPPPQLTAESSALAQTVDGIIIVVSLRKSNREATIQLAEKFKKEKILGIVANRQNRGSAGYYGSDKYTTHR